MLSLLLSIILRTVHFVVFLFMLGGWLISSKSVATAYVVVIPLVVLHWWTNDGVCILTQWDNRLRGVLLQKEAQQGHFVKSIVRRALGCVPTDRALKAIVYSLLLIGWCAAASRV